MSNLPATTNIQITTSAGEVISVNPGQALKFIKPQPQAEYQDFTPVWQLLAGQSAEDRMEGEFKNLFLMRSTKDEEGKVKTETIMLGPSARVYAVAVNLPVRSAMPPGPFEKGRQPICKSTDFFHPDPFIRKPDGTLTPLRDQVIPGSGGVIAHQCAVIDPAKGVVTVCPLAQWTMMKAPDGSIVRDPKTNKPRWNKPVCQPQYRIGVAVWVEQNQKMELAEVTFKSTSERDGLAIYGTVNDMETPWIHPIDLQWEKAGSGGVIKGGIDTFEVTEWDEAGTKELQALADRYKAIGANRLQYATVATPNGATPNQPPAEKPEPQISSNEEKGTTIDTRAELI